MKWLVRVLRAFFVWWLPTMLLVLALVVGLAFWLMASERGTRLLLTTAASQFDGVATDVRGSLLGGVHVGQFAIDLPGVAIQADDLTLDVEWKTLSDRRVHVRELAASRLAIALDSTATTADNEDETASGDIVLPVDVAVDDLRIDAFFLTQDGEPLPVALTGLQATLAAAAGGGAQLRVNALHVAHEVGEADVEAQVALEKLGDPWPLNARVIAAAQGRAPDSPLCVDRVWADTAAARRAPANGATAVKAPGRDGEKAAAGQGTSTADAGAAATAGNAAAAPDVAMCTVVVQARAEGSLDGMKVTLDGEGSGVALDVVAELTPRGLFPLRTAVANLRLPDGSGLSADVDWTSTQDGPVIRDRLTGKLDVRRLDVGRLVGDAIPPALIGLNGAFDIALRDQSVLESADVDVTIADGSRWNRQPLAGRVKGRVLSDVPATGAPAADPLAALRLEALDIDLKVAANRLRMTGSLGQTASAVDLDLNAPRLEALWPDVPGGATLKGKVGGTVAAHEGNLTASYKPAKPRANVLGEAPADLSLQFKGGWGPGQGSAPGAALTGWRGTLDKLRAAHAGFGVTLSRPVEVAYVPEAAEPAWQWQVGAASLALSLPNKQSMVLAHGGSRGGGGRWETAGRIDNAVVNRALVRGVMGALDPETLKRDDADAGRINGRAPESARQIALDASWDLKFAGTLTGQARIARRSGDLLIPGDPPIPLGLRALSVDVTISALTARTSRVQARLNAATARMGNINGTATAVLAANAEGGLALDTRQPVQADINADIEDLSWVSLFTGDSIELGGAVNASVRASGLPGKPWQTSGTVTGRNLKVVQIDNGIRLFDGTLDARLDGNTVVLNSLRFPASLRVMPNEWRTRTWITEEADAKNGYLQASGRWDLLESAGRVHVDVHRFPIIQRSDRYAMVSGVVDIDAALPRIAITGDIKADAGWVSLDILQSVPALDDDVRIRQPGDSEKVDVPLQATMNLKYDMGPRFYITGMGLNAGIVGSMQILLNDGRLSGAGVLRTRGGRIEAYGQGLQLRRGTVTFQGALDNPILDIEALRTNQQVEAGVKVGGTAQRPRIDLVSYPDVSDVEKLSWLILGRGPDDSGGEAALLLSAGAALLGGDEPFYRKFGLDDVTVRSGAIGSSGSILPDRTVVSSVNSSPYDLSSQFIVASKRFANGITLSVEQSMSGSGTVGRASYLLTKGLSVDLKGGTVTGLSLVYRTFFQ